MNVTAWASGLEVTGDGTGIVSHAGLGLLRRLADKTGLPRGLSQALFSGRLLQHDRGRVLADISCAIADGARAISDFELLAADDPVAAWRGRLLDRFGGLARNSPAYGG